MKILNGAQLQLIDQLTIQRQGISSWELMERAALKAVEAMESDFGEGLQELPIVIICGKGNNGGDGLAIGRILGEQGYNVEVKLLHSENYSPDNLINQQKLGAKEMFTLDDDLKLPASGLLIDCLFGSGLHSELGISWVNIIRRINGFGGPVVSIDMPSGLLTDRLIDSGAPMVHADKVYTFQVPKLNLLLPAYGYAVGGFTVLDIGLDTQALDEAEGAYHYTVAEDVAGLLRPRSRFSHKGTFGHACLIGGSEGKMGAVVMSARASLRSGCGLLTAVVPQIGHPILQSTVPEAMLSVDSGKLQLEEFSNNGNFQAFGVGIGMGKGESTVRGFSKWMQDLKSQARIILDADALNILSEHADLLKFLPRQTILTPHPKELQRLIGEWSDDYEKIEMAKTFARAHGVILLIKGAHTAIIDEDGSCYFNSTGNPGMATGGSGDVLTGIICSLLAQGYVPLEAAKLGVFIHGLTADLAKEKFGEISMLPTDLIDFLPMAFEKLKPRSYLA
ncbi:NAD(P)H-hydrate dehydratase [Sphingobacterium lactis]|uniref:Bifunctional NAD(P)H-hydrate repair enzyme n=1 Tax=Sphingobacterium lactis TaxID=797291 RepID=A0A1H5Y580_9SPHI|nr:NAD(P)H-hydrate dehydratase [Sphingobacterium lactis]SEG19078.1 NAD(P)H-hydrate epimerase [Sphingobacterium lactis]